jgi:hypothetical protein
MTSVGRIGPRVHQLSQLRGNVNKAFLKKLAVAESTSGNVVRAGVSNSDIGEDRLNELANYFRNASESRCAYLTLKEFDISTLQSSALCKIWRDVFGQLLTCSPI